MNTVNMIAFELGIDEIKTLDKNTQILVYNSLTDSYRVVRAVDILFQTTNIYYALDYPKFKEKESEI